MLMKWFIGNEKDRKRSSVIWNAIGGAANACQSAIILIFISHKLGIMVAGIVTIAYAVANLFMSMEKYGMRNYQVTDVNEKFSFKDYLYARFFVLIGVVIISVIYLMYCIKFNDYSMDKVLIFFEVIILKLIDGFEDVYLGRYQQVGRLDIGAKVVAVRMIVSTILICVLVLAGAGINISLLGGIISSILMDICFIKGTFKLTHSKDSTGRRKSVFSLLKVCLPLCVGTTLSIYIGNVPKYMIDSYMNEEVQAIFGYIMMPVFVIMLLNNFIYQPMVKELGDLWEAKDYRTFKKKNIRQCGIVAALMLFILTAGLIAGLPILSLMYNVDLTSYRLEFAILLFGGGFYALAFYLNVPITTIRRHNYIALGYAMAAILAVVLGKVFVTTWGMLGAAYLYLAINMLLSIIYTAVLIMGIKEEERKKISSG